MLKKLTLLHERSVAMNEALIISSVRYHEHAEAMEELNGQLRKEIAERKQTEQQLQISEIRYRRLFEATHDGVLIVDARTRKIIDANPFMATLLGYTHDELVGKELWEIGLLKDKEGSRKAFRELKEKGLIRYESLPLETKTGQRREVEFVSNLYQESGATVIQCNIRDITGRKNTEQKLAEKARLLDLTKDAIIVCSLDDRISVWNKGAEVLYGWTFAEVVGKELHSLLQTEFPKQRSLEKILAQLYRDGFYTDEVVQVARDGRRILSLCRWFLDPETKSLLTSYTDITERAQAEEALRASEDRYRTLFNSIDEGFCVIELIFDKNKRAIDYLFLEVNPSFEKQSGLHDATGKRICELVRNFEEHWLETYGRVALTGEPIRYVNESKAMGRWFDVFAFRLGGPESRRLAVLFTDITARKQIEAELSESRKKIYQQNEELETQVIDRTVKLQDSIKSLESLNYTMAHDLRAPIRAMKGFTHAMLEEVPLNEMGNEYAQKINKAATRMDQLVDDLLDYGELTHLEFPVRPLGLRIEIDDTLAEHAKEIAASDAEVQVCDPLPNVLANATLLQQILTNLLLNALKFIVPRTKPKVLFRAEPRGPMVRLWVEDNGIGIDPQYRERIFGVFQRLHTTEEYPGTGVGLAIVKRAIERMNGHVGLESELGKGSRFWIDLPKAD